MFLHPSGVPANLEEHFGEVVHLQLDLSEQKIQGTGSTHSEALLDLVKRLPADIRLQFRHQIQSERGLLELQEIVGLTEPYSDGERYLHFHLCLVFEDQVYEAEAGEDFSIALHRLQDQIALSLQICAYCAFSDFQSFGGEDLRHGWYCFRELQDVDLSTPWHTRMDTFKDAIAHVSAMYKCSAFVQTAKRY